MIFQIPIDLNIEDRTVQAIIDLDTGFIGFTESKNGEEIEYYYAESPLEFKQALLKSLEPIFGERNLVNFKISGKNEHMKYVSRYLRENGNSDTRD